MCEQCVPGRIFGPGNEATISYDVYKLHYSRSPYSLVLARPLPPHTTGELDSNSNFDLYAGSAMTLNTSFSH